jgi:hypothetical protein
MAQRAAHGGNGQEVLLWSDSCHHSAFRRTIRSLARESHQGEITDHIHQATVTAFQEIGKEVLCAMHGAPKF